MTILILHSLVLVVVVWLRGLLMGGGFSLPYSSGTNDRRPFWAERGGGRGGLGTQGHHKVNGVTI